MFLVRQKETCRPHQSEEADNDWGRQPGGISVCSSEAHDAQAEPAGSHVPKGRGLCCLVNSAAPKGPRTQHRAAGACTVQTSSRAGAGPWPKRLLQPGHGQCLAEAVRKTACVRVSVCLCGCVSVSLLVNMSKQSC